MKDYFAHESAFVDKDCKIGSGTKIWHFSHIMASVPLVKIVILDRMLLYLPKWFWGLM